MFYLEPNDHEGKGNNHDASVSNLQLQLLPFVLWRDDSVDESSWAIFIFTGRIFINIYKFKIFTDIGLNHTPECG